MTLPPHVRARRVSDGMITPSLTIRLSAAPSLALNVNGNRAEKGGRKESTRIATKHP